MSVSTENTNQPSEQEELSILIVEDSTLTASQIRESIESALSGVKCSVVSTEEEAITVITLEGPQVVVLDLWLKVGNGFGVLNHLAGEEKRPLIIVATNYAIPPMREFALLRGADYFLDKALTIDELPNILKSAIQSRH